MNIEEIMSIDVKNLRQKQKKALKAYITNRLRKIIQFVEEEKWDRIEDYCCYSPAGDCMGTNHDFIDFSYNKNQDDGSDIDNGLDILEIIDNIKAL